MTQKLKELIKKADMASKAAYHFSYASIGIDGHKLAAKAHEKAAVLYERCFWTHY